jgi:hypothetical protein
MIDKEIQQRFDELIEKGRQIVGQISYFEGSPYYWYRKEEIADIQSWIASAGNFFRLTASPDTYLYQESNRILEDSNLRRGVPFYVVQKLLGLLQSIKIEIERGFLKKAEYLFIATTFDDFLNHASTYHKGGKKIESAVLTSAVFEDTIRKISKKNELSEKGKSLETIIDELTKKNIFTYVKAKRIKGYSAIRNKALHAQWDDFDIRDVGELIKGTRELIETYL